MENKSDYKNEKFDSFLNKTIIFSAKKFYKEKATRDSKELKIVDDENYLEYMNEYLKCEDSSYNFTNTKDFMALCNNPILIHALKSLSNIEITVIFLLFEEQLTSAEASKILKICSDSVTRIKRRALKKIEKYLKGGK